MFNSPTLASLCYLCHNEMVVVWLSSCIYYVRRTYECRYVLPLLNSSVGLVLGESQGQPGALFRVHTHMHTCVYTCIQIDYRIVGKFGEDLNLAIWRVVRSSPCNVSLPSKSIAAFVNLAKN